MMKEFKIGKQLRNMEKTLPFIPLIILSSVFIISVFISVANADTTQYCRDNVTLVHIDTSSIYVPELGITRTFNTTENETCPYNCDISHNVCFNQPSKNWLMMIFVILGLVGFIIVMRVIFG